MAKVIQCQFCNAISSNSDNFVEHMLFEYKVRFERVDAIYRFWRRYLAKLAPDIMKIISVETLTTEEIQKKEEKLLHGTKN